MQPFLPDSAASFEIQAVAGIAPPNNRWQLTITADRLLLRETDATAAPHELLLDNAPKEMHMMPGGSIAMKVPFAGKDRFVAFKLGQPASDELERWLAPKVDDFIALSLRKSGPLFFILGLGSMLVAFPFSRAVAEFQLLQFVMGAAIAVAGAVSFWLRNLSILLLHASVATILTLVHTVSAFVNTWWSIVWALLFFFCAMGSFTEYRRFSRIMTLR